jgi:pyruvate/2-oxoglutarate dehydrogenase complex dihydrolipoamide acyltransferase (E2) component
VSSSTTEIDVTMPQMGVSVSEGTIVGWHKKVGDWVAYEEPLCEISTDKIDTECPAPAAGRVKELLVEVGATVEVGTVLARIATDAKPGEAHPAEDAPQPAAAAPAAVAAAGGRHNGNGNGNGTAPPRRGYSPVVSRIAAEHGLDLSAIAGTGRGGRVTKKDVLAALEAPAPADPAPAPAAPSEPPLHSESPYRPDADVPTVAAGGDGGTPVPLSRMRIAIGEAMRRSLQTAATCTTIVECDMSAVQRHRAELGLTALPLVARHVVGALGEFGALNATLEGTALTRYERVHLGIAVSLGEDGLIVPVVRDAQDLSEEGLARRIKDLAARARSGGLSPDEVRGGTFTITNPGAFGALAATPVINLPQVGILDLEAIVKRPVVLTDADGNDSIAIRPMANLCLSWDHRALDGAYAAQFLTALRRRIEGA